MKLPGMQFLHERDAVRKFERQDASFRDLVFYSESPSDWAHVGPVVRGLLERDAVNISYLASDPSDPGLGIEHPRLRSFAIGSGTARTVLFARIACRRFAMTLPDLGNLWLKRSVHPVQYIYFFHSINSTHAAYRKSAFDHYDQIFCVGPHHEAEIRRTEEVYGLPTKGLVEHGSARLDALLSEFSEPDPPTPARDVPTILVAPTWGDDSLLEAGHGIRLVDALIHSGFRTIVRPHPMTSRRMPETIDRLSARYEGSSQFSLDQDMNSSDSWRASDLMISDFSGAAMEYAFALLKPVAYVDLPPKTMNPDWSEVGLEPLERSIRSSIGTVVSLDDLEQLPARLEPLLNRRDDTVRRVRDAREAAVYNVGRSTSAAVDALLADAKP